MFNQLKEAGFDVLTLQHAEAIISHDMVAAEKDIQSVLLQETLPIQELIESGGGEALYTQRLRRSFSELGLKKHNFNISKVVDGIEKESRSHEVDHVKTYDGFTLAMEIEWNNKDPFFDRDLENFKRLHSEGAISLGVIITRGSSLQNELEERVESFAHANELNSIEDLSRFYSPTIKQKNKIEATAASLGSFQEAWAKRFVGDKFGKATTHWEKLEARVERGVGNPCPLLLIGLPTSIVSD